MAENAKLSGPVGAAREGKGAKVSNKKDDVILVREMLRFNGWYNRGEGNCDQKLIDLIKGYQKKAVGVKEPDGIVDPGGRTFKKLLPKYTAAQKKLAELEKELEETNLAIFKYQGKEYRVNEEDYFRIQKETLKHLSAYVDVLEKRVINNRKNYSEIMLQVNYMEGVSKNIATALIFTFRDVTPPNEAQFKKSESYLKKVRQHISSANFKGLEADLIRLDYCMDQAHAENIRYLREFQGAAKLVGDVASTGSAVGFAIVGIFAAPVILASAAAAGVTVTAGTTIAVSAGTGAGLAALQTGSQELARHAYGAKPGETLGKSLQKVLVDAAFGGILGGIGAKLNAKTLDEAGTLAAAQLAKQMPMLSKENAKRLMGEYLEEAAKGGGKELINQFGKLIKQRLDNNSKIDEAYLKKSMSEILIAAFSAGLTKKLGDATKKFEASGSKFVQDSVVSPNVDKILKSKFKLNPRDLTGTERKDLVAKVTKDVSQKVMTKGSGKIYDMATAKDKPQDVVDKVQKSLVSDSAVQKMTEKAIADYIKKEGLDKKNAKAGGR